MTGLSHPASRPGTAGASSTSPVRTRDPLAAVGSVPAKTLAFVEESKARAGDSYSVVFVPYGYGPGGKGRSLVVRVNRSTAMESRVGLPA